VTNTVSFGDNTYSIKDYVIGYDIAEPGSDKSMMTVGRRINGILYIEDSFELKIEPGAAWAIMKTIYNKQNRAYRGKQGSWHIRNIRRNMA